MKTLLSKRAETRRRWKKLAPWADLYLMLIPAVLITFIFCYIPMYGVQIAFKDYRTSLGIWGSPWAGLKHFIRFVTYPNFWLIMKNTLLISLYSIATFPIPVVFALLINELDNRVFKRAVQMVSYAPHFISTVVLCGMVILFLRRSSGVFNNLRELAGLQRMDCLTIPTYFRTIYVWSGVWQGLGWGTIIYLAALAGVSPEMVEAARIDGATRLQIVTRINFPTILPTVVIMFILRCGSILSVDFQKVLLLQNPLNLDASTVLSTYTYEVGFVSGQFSYSSAIGLFNNAVSITLILLVNWISKRVADIGLL